ncbi:beta-galactosidase trimerization domain-containing protein [Paenibacillus sp. IB182496]|uniref:Beta-galactosidase trimerization domain-containing protein n=1 Tax=Paenibacillus sabuli TaxID=2772509 RepID=A0A927BR23_9BACL|nr:beta-galactosidase trimerization domain-containing protein [Paenibacillus sabuli]MBD2844135.1 beta-galactosidase trimerization domain-containing protein [Paenibacillus sabuli]
MSQSQQWWRNRPWRQIQTNLREIDMRDIDAERYVADLQAFNANVAMINTAGIIASYPTKLPYHFQSSYLTGDSLEEIIAACHRADIRVIARTDFSKVRRPLYEQHPEWAYKSPDGVIVDYNGDVHVCLNGEYQQRCAPEIIKEAITELDVDGIFFNMGGYQVTDYSYRYYGICHCDSCRRAFAKAYGLDLPKEEDLRDPAFRYYRQFQASTLAAYEDKITDVILKARPDICIANCLRLQEGMIRQESNTALDRPLPRWPYSASENTKWAVGTYPSMVSSNTTVDFLDFSHRHVAVSPAQQQLRLAQALANGGGLDYYLIGRLDNHEDRSGFAGIKEMFRYHATHGEQYVNLESRAEVALLNAPVADQAEFRGWYRVLTEHHFLFDVLLVPQALQRPWDKYKAILVPDVRQLSDEVVSRLDAYAAAGGTLVSTCASGFENECGEARTGPPFASMGMHDILSLRADNRASYFKLDCKERFPRFVDTDLIYLDTDYVFAAYRDETKRYFRLVPPHRFGPPERCYYTQVTEHPGFTVHRYGSGQGIYIPWKPGEHFYRHGYTNTSDFAADLLEHVAGVPRLRGSLPPMVEATLFEQQSRDATLLQLVNGTGHFGVTFFAPAALSGLEVGFAYEAAPQSVYSLVAEAEREFEYRAGVLTIKLDRLELFEAIKISR